MLYCDCSYDRDCLVRVRDYRVAVWVWERVEWDYWRVLWDFVRDSCYMRSCFRCVRTVYSYCYSYTAF